MYSYAGNVDVIVSDAPAYRVQHPDPVIEKLLNASEHVRRTYDSIGERGFRREYLCEMVVCGSTEKEINHEL